MASKVEKDENFKLADKSLKRIEKKLFLKFQSHNRLERKIMKREQRGREGVDLAAGF